MIGRTIRNLKIVSEIGRGGMGVVYLAEHLTLDKKFAVKSLSPALTRDDNFRKRFFQEARNQAMLDHVNIVQATDFIEDDGKFFFVMAFVDGKDLGRMIRQQGAIPAKQAVSIITDVLEGLQAAHAKGIVHRDVKPSNILIDQHGHARITDFGIAMMIGSERLTVTQGTIGSPWYMSPEQITEPAAIDQRSDIYSVGIVLFEMLTGDIPFDGASEFVIKSKQVNENPPDPHECNANIPQELAKIILKALEKSPAERFQQCEEFLRRLHEYASTAESTWTKWKKVIVIGGAVMIAGVVCALIFIPSIHNGTRVVYKNGPASARILIQGALEKATIICRELDEIEIKRKNVPIVQDLGDSKLIDDYNRHIREKEQNIIDGISSYGDLINQLAALNPEDVDAAFDNFSRALITSSKIRKAKLTTQVESTYRSVKDNHRAVDRAAMRQACSAH